MSKYRFIPGFQAVRAALLCGNMKNFEVWVADGKRGSRVADILRIAEERGIPIQRKSVDEMNRNLSGINHQGIAILMGGFFYDNMEEMAQRALNTQRYALLIAADHITDEGNLGALIRTAAFFGVQGLILPKDRSAGASERVLKISSGAYVHLPITRVVNLGRSLEQLKEKGFWIIGTAGESEHTIYQFDWDRDLVLILGSEDRGLSHAVRRKCDQLVGIPSYGQLASLNVAVAGGIILSEIVRQQRGGEKSGARQ